MTRRASLPGAEELFRSTGDPATEEQAPEIDKSISKQVASTPGLQMAHAPVPAPVPAPAPIEAPGPKHNEKITFYCTAEDLTRVERARLALRSEHRISSDRGRLVRAALAEILDDFEARGQNSLLVRRLGIDR